MSTDTSTYLAMERAAYAELVKRSKFQDETFAAADSVELVVGSYAQHERFDYERWLFGGVSIGPDAVAIEYGCGPGRMLLRMAPLFDRVDGIDISPDVLEIARQRCQSLGNQPRLIVTDGQDVPVDAATYDVAYSVICLQHICVHTVRKRILEGLFRALKPGGLLTFQMGYGPGHAARVEYFTDFVQAKGANGAVDVSVLHPAEIAADLSAIGFTSMWYALTPTGPGDVHGAWIFFRAVKPGAAACIGLSEADWREGAFEPAAPDVMAMNRARRIQFERGIVRRSQKEEATIADLRRRLQEQRKQLIADWERERDALSARIATLDERAAGHQRELATLGAECRRLEDALAFARADRDAYQQRAAQVTGENQQLWRRVELDERQLRRLRAADSHRVKAMLRELVDEAINRNLRVGVLGAGAHTEWLLRETALGNVKDLQFFDSDPSRYGATLAGRPVRPIADLPAAGVVIVLVSSLAFQDEMVDVLRSLPIDRARIVRCYP